MLCWFRFISYERQISIWNNWNYPLTYSSGKQALTPADHYGCVYNSRTENTCKRFSFNKMKIVGYSKLLADCDHYGLILIWLFGLLKVRNVLFWKHISNIQSNSGNNSDSSLFTCSISPFSDKSVNQLKDYSFLSLSYLFWLSTTNHYDSSSSHKSFVLCSSLIMTGSMDLFP